MVQNWLHYNATVRGSTNLYQRLSEDQILGESSGTKLKPFGRKTRPHQSSESRLVQNSNLSRCLPRKTPCLRRGSTADVGIPREPGRVAGARSGGGSNRSHSAHASALRGSCPHKVDGCLRAITRWREKCRQKRRSRRATLSMSACQ